MNSLRLVEREVTTGKRFEFASGLERDSKEMREAVGRPERLCRVLGDREEGKRDGGHEGEGEGNGKSESERSIYLIFWPLTCEGGERRDEGQREDGEVDARKKASE